MENIIYPPRCPGCGSSVAVHGEWCSPCAAKLFHFRMLNGSRKRLGLDGCYALADYDGAVRRAVSRLKYHGKLHYGDAFFYMLECFPWPERLTACDVIVPVPLYPAKEKSAASIKMTSSLSLGPSRTDSYGCLHCSASVRRHPSGVCKRRSGRKI